MYPTNQPSYQEHYIKMFNILNIADYIRDMIVLDDNSVIINGNMQRGTFDIFVFRINTITGNIIWFQSFGGILDDSGGGLKLMNDNNLAIIGLTRSYNNSNILYGYIAKINVATGNLIWFKTFGKKNKAIRHINGFDMMRSDNSIIIFGKNDAENNLFIIKLNQSNGNKS